MNKILVILTLLLFSVSAYELKAQTKDQPLGFEVTFGTHAYDGDLGNNMIQFTPNNYTYGVGLSAYLGRFFDLTAEAKYMQLDYYNDSNDSIFKKRNTYFETDNLNINTMLLFKPFDTRLNPYIAGGVGANFLRNEDNILKDDDNFIWTVPFGIGVNYQMSEHFSLNVQSIYNRSFSDSAIDHYPIDNSKVTAKARENSRSRSGLPLNDFDRNIDGKDHDDFLTTTISLVVNFAGGESEEENLNQELYDRSLMVLNNANNVLVQAQVLNDSTLSALKQLKEDRKQTPIQTTQLKQELIRIVNNIQFEFDRSTIIEPAKDELNSLAHILNTFDKLHVNIEGYADERGSNEYNDKLSMERANAVKDYLMTAGVDSSRITVSFHGERQELMDSGDDNETVYAQNRAVSLTLSYEGN